MHINTNYQKLSLLLKMEKKSCWKKFSPHNSKKKNENWLYNRKARRQPLKTRWHARVLKGILLSITSPLELKIMRRKRTAPSSRACVPHIPANSDVTHRPWKDRSAKGCSSLLRDRACARAADSGSGAAAGDHVLWSGSDAATSSLARICLQSVRLGLRLLTTAAATRDGRRRRLKIGMPLDSCLPGEVALTTMPLEESHPLRAWAWSGDGVYVVNCKYVVDGLRDRFEVCLIG